MKAGDLVQVGDHGPVMRLVALTEELAIVEPLKLLNLDPGACEEPADPFDLIHPPEDAYCRVCGCTELSPCEGGCSWVADPEGLGDLCSACLMGVVANLAPTTDTERAWVAHEQSCESCSIADGFLSLCSTGLLLLVEASKPYMGTWTAT